MTSLLNDRGEPKSTDTAAPSGSAGYSRTLRWRLLALLLLIAAVAIVCWRLLSLQHQPVRRGRGGFGTQPVGVATIDTRDIRRIEDALGTVTPLATVTVQTQISGQLMKVGFKEGELVHAGDFLAQIDPRPYEAALEQYQGQLERDRATLKQAQMDLTRYQGLQNLDAIARQTAEDQVWLVKQDAGTVALDEAQVKTQQLNLTYCRISSPVDGRVGLRLVDPGNYVQTSSTTGLVVITELNPISVIFTVPEDDVPEIVSRFQAGTPLVTAAFDRANATQLAIGKVSSFDTEVDTTTGTVKIRAQFQNDANRLFPFQFVNIRLVLDTLHNAVTVPVAAVQHGAPGAFVYLVDANDTVAVRPVKLGPQDGDYLAVTTGLTVGDRVVTDGVDQLRDGSHVTVRAADAATSGPALPRRPHRPGSSTPPAGKPGSDTPGQHHHRPRPPTQQGSDPNSS